MESPQFETEKLDSDARLSIIMKNLFRVTFKRVSNGMLHSDKPLLALLLLRIHLRCSSIEPTYEECFDHLLQRSDTLISEETATKMQNEAENIILKPLNNNQKVALIKLSRIPGFKDCITKAQSSNEFAKWITLDKLEINVIPLWDNNTQITPIKKALNELLIIHALRPDRLLASVHLLVNTAFSNNFMHQDEVLCLQDIVNNEVKSHVPILLCSSTGYDASGRVEDLAIEMNRKITSIAIGSSEGFNQADLALNSSTKSGQWLLLKNVHLAPSWLTQIEKKLRDLKPNSQFRLLLTSEIHPKLPTSVIQVINYFIF